MNRIDKISSITCQDVADYIRLDTVTEEDVNMIGTLLSVSKAFVCQYTGRTIEELDRCPDMVIVVLVLCQDMWDNRTLYVDNTNLSHVVETILGMHAVNLL